MKEDKFLDEALIKIDEFRKPKKDILMKAQ
jgi:hypothetical protein